MIFNIIYILKIFCIYQPKKNTKPTLQNKNILFLPLVSLLRRLFPSGHPAFAAQGGPSSAFDAGDASGLCGAQEVRQQLGRRLLGSEETRRFPERWITMVTRTRWGF